MSRKTKKIIWHPEQDKALTEMVNCSEKADWAHIATQIYRQFRRNRKSNRQCRERWYNHLKPGIMKEEWTLEQEDRLFDMHRRMGNRWSVIAKDFPGKTSNHIKNHFYSTIRKSLRRINKFLGSSESTIKIKKIKPSTLTRVFNMKSDMSGLDMCQDRDEASIADFEEGKEIAYHLLKFSRNNLSEHKNICEFSQMETLRALLEAMHGLNDKYECNKIVLKKIKRENEKLRRFDKIIEKEEEEESEVSIDSSILSASKSASLRFKQHRQMHDQQSEQQIVDPNPKVSLLQFELVSVDFESLNFFTTEPSPKICSNKMEVKENDILMNVQEGRPATISKASPDVQKVVLVDQALSNPVQIPFFLDDEDFTEVDDKLEEMQMTPYLITPQRKKGQWLKQLSHCYAWGQQCDEIIQKLVKKNMGLASYS